MGKDWQAVREGIRAYLGTDIALLNTTNDALLENGGKQLRPMLSLLVARACNNGSANDDSIKFAVASELLHNATLLHDDVADDADERRGKPTLRRLMGPNVSVLVGDFWLVRAMRAVLSAKTGHDRAIEMFAKTLSDLAEGEMLQLQKASSCDTDFDDYQDIIYRKTGSLFVAATLTAAISVGASPEQEAAIESFARNIGYAFQMRDDIFDYMPSANVGKAVGIDIMERKITLPLLAAFENVAPEEERCIREMVKDITPSKRDEVFGFVRSNGGLERAQAIMEEYSAKAADALACLPPTREREILCEMAGYVARRAF